MVQQTKNETEGYVLLNVLSVLLKDILQTRWFSEENDSFHINKLKNQDRKSKQTRYKQDIDITQFITPSHCDNLNL